MKKKDEKSNVGTHGSCVLWQQRKSPRAVFHNYSGGDYFVTICTRGKEHYFGKIIDGNMQYTSIGKYCEQQITEISGHYPYASVSLFVVMPNHVHAIIHIDGTIPDSGKMPDNNRTHEPCVPTERTALSVVIGGFKRAVTMFARRNDIDFGWQSRYHDHIIRGNHDGNMISEYIINNVARWASDCFCN